MRFVGKNDAEFKRLHSTVLYGDELIECWFQCGSAKETPLIELLKQFAGRDKSDTRDRIYGLLGLTCRMDRDALTPDHSRGNKASILFEAVATHFIQNNEDPMQVLYYACPYYSIESKKHIQLLRGEECIDAIFSDAFHTIFAKARKTVETSWVPRWKQSDRIVLPFSLFRCAGDMKATMQVMTDPKVVWRDESPRKTSSVQGAIVGRISAAASVEIVTDWTYFFNEVQQKGNNSGFTNLLKTAHSEQELIAVVSKTMKCDSLRASNVQLTEASLETDFKRLMSLSDRKRVPSWLQADSGLKRECCNPLLDCFLCDSRSLLLAVLCLFWPYMGPWGPPLARYPSQPVATLQQRNHAKTIRW